MTAHHKKIDLHSPVGNEVKRPTSDGRTAPMLARLVGLGLLAACMVSQPVSAAPAAAHASDGGRVLSTTAGAVRAAPIVSQAMAQQTIKRAHFAQEIASDDARSMADWIVDSGDNQRLPFLIVDKAHAKVFMFDAAGKIQGAAAALLGMGLGDDSIPDIGKRKLSTIRPHERTTPAGRFVANLGRNLHGKEILWVDYDGAISLHRVITSNPREQRADRLTSSTTADNRISYGCINVPVNFYERIVSPAFKQSSGIVYVLPETRSARETFGSYDVDERARQQQAVAPALVEGQVPDGRIIRLR